MFEWKFKYSRAIIFGIIFLVLLGYTILVFIPEKKILNSFDNEPVRIKSASELEDNYNKMVEIEYEYGFSALYMRGYYFAPNRDYGVLKLASSKDLVICSSPSLINVTLNDSFFLADKNNKIVPKSNGNTIVVTGYIGLIDEQDQKMLNRQIKSLFNTREMPDSNKAINYMYVVQILNPDQEKKSHKNQIKILVCIIVVFLISLILLIKEIFRYKNYGLEEKERESKYLDDRSEDQN